MNISLTPELAKLVEDKVASGMYTSASEVVREALRLLAESDRLRDTREAELRQQVAKGVASAKAGRLKSGDEVISRLHARLARLEKDRPAR
ncbi:MAG TPA: type II toxin-antitoxin system ParD family antitoxin [Planctomycetota bacterium]|nr:type II toxin-antitoxin system ParD family antitoxin [Planctomycetota bacterium]